MSQLSPHSASQYSPIKNHDTSAKSTSPMTRALSIKKHGPAEQEVTVVPSSFRRIVLQFWLTEWLAWLFALAAIGGMIAVLVVFDGRPLPNWPYGITLSALVSLLATLAVVALMIPIGSGIGQSQWLWFQRERYLRDFDFIDEATRSPYGSLRLLARGRGGFFALSGALLTIMILAVAPFSQQVVHFSQQTVNSTAAAVAIADEYNTFGQGTILTTDVDLSMKAAVQRALLDVSANTQSFSVSPQCSTGNCTWPSYTSLSVCGRCADVSSMINVTTSGNGTALAALPNNVTLEYVPATTKEGFVAMTINTTSDALDEEIKSLKFAQYTFPIVDVFTLIAPYPDGPFASECILQFCVQEYSSKSVNGAFNESTLGQPQYLNTNGSVTNLTVSGKNYSVEYETMNGLSEYMQDLFQSVVHQMDSLSPQAEWPDDVSQSIFTWTNQSSNHLPTELFQNMAASMSLNIRSKSGESSPGVASTTKSVVSIKWYWMILPFIILTLVFVYLVAIILVSKARGLPQWRNSILSHLMHGVLDDSSRHLVSGAIRLEEMEALADVLKAQSVFGGDSAGDRKTSDIPLRDLSSHTMS